MKVLNAVQWLGVLLCINIAPWSQTLAQQEESSAPAYGYTEFEASGSREAHAEFLTGLLQLHNFEYEDARASMQRAIAIDPNFTMAYWGEALSYEHSFWRRFDTEASRAVLARLGATPEARAARAATEREKAYLQTVEILFGEGEQQEREVRYSAALRDLSERYPDDLDAAAFYALSILFTTYGGRDYTRYMQAAAISEQILDKNPLHPGALHYSIHSYDDPIHAALGLRAARDYIKVAPSAVHALHMGSHIYFALGMWDEGIDRNIRSFEESVARQASPDDPYGNQAYHALTWLIYALTQHGDREQARGRLAMIAKQVEQYGADNPAHRGHFVAARASYIVDTQEWDSDYASVEIDHSGLDSFAIATDQYVRGLVAINRSDMAGAKSALAAMSDEEIPFSPERRVMAPKLLRLALEGQIALAAGDHSRALALIGEATNLEGQIPAAYGPAVPVQPMAELLADTHLALGDLEQAVEFYELSLKSAVGRERSLVGLAAISGGSSMTTLSKRADPLAGITTSAQPDRVSLRALAAAGYSAVIDLRAADEDRGFDEAGLVEDLGMSYIALPVAGAADANFQNASALDRLLAGVDGPVLIHCASGNRAGALLALRAKLNGADNEAALDLGRKAGLTQLEPAVEARLAER